MKECAENNSKKIFKNPEVIELPKQKLEATYTKEMISEMYKNVIEKNAQNSRTSTTIRQLSDDGQIRELARMLGGDTITDAVINNAAEMRQQALETKKKLETES